MPDAMAERSRPREDLLRDARALTPRVQLRLIPSGAIVLAGFRGESLSLYFGEDPAFHFNSRGQLRRAYVDDRLLKAEQGRLTSLVRERLADRVVMHAEQLDEPMQQKLLGGLAARLAQLAAALSSKQFVIEGQVPHSGNAVERLADWLVERPAPSAARSPRVD